MYRTADNQQKEFDQKIEEINERFQTYRNEIIQNIDDKLDLKQIQIQTLDNQIKDNV